MSYSVKIDYAIRKTAKVRIKFSYVNFLVRIIICVCVILLYICVPQVQFWKLNLCCVCLSGHGDIICVIINLFWRKKFSLAYNYFMRMCVYMTCERNLVTPNVFQRVFKFWRKKFSLWHTYRITLLWNFFNPAGYAKIKSFTKR